MFAYFNELSANGCIHEASLPTVIQTLVECLKILSKKQVSGINLDKKIGQYQLTVNRWFLDILDDKSIVDDDMKTLILDMMTTLERPMDDLENEDFIQASCNGDDCIGMGLASEEISNTFSVSLSSTQWNETNYQIALIKLSTNEYGELIEQEIKSSCKNVSVPAHIDYWESLFYLMPASGKEMYLRLSELFPHLIFSSKAKNQIRRCHDRSAIEQIYMKLQDVNEAAKKLNGGDIRKELFHYKASQEHEQRSQLPEMDVLFDDGITRHCEWHLRFTPGCGRIHFSTDGGNGQTIYVGHIGGKLGIH